MTIGIPNLLEQVTLDVNHISEVKILLKDQAEHIRLVSKFEHQGVLFLEIEKRHVEPTVRYRVLVLGESLTQHGQVVLMRLSDNKAKATTTHGLELKTDGGICNTHWCSGLAVKQVPTAKKMGVTIAKRKLHDFRETLCKDLLEIIKNDEAWGRQKWKDVQGMIDNVGPLLISKPSIKSLHNGTAGKIWNTIGTTGMTQENIDGGLMKLLSQSIFAFFMVNIKWGGKISDQVQDAEMEDAEMTIADEDSLSEISIDMDE